MGSSFLPFPFLWLRSPSPHPQKMYHLGFLIWLELRGPFLSPSGSGAGHVLPCSSQFSCIEGALGESPGLVSSLLTTLPSNLSERNLAWLSWKRPGTGPPWGLLRYSLPSWLSIPVGYSLMPCVWQKFPSSFHRGSVVQWRKFQTWDPTCLNSNACFCTCHLGSFA